jgi:hypothetical protein
MLYLRSGLTPPGTTNHVNIILQKSEYYKPLKGTPDKKYSGAFLAILHKRNWK